MSTAIQRPAAGARRIASINPSRREAAMPRKISRVPKPSAKPKKKAKRKEKSLLQNLVGSVVPSEAEVKKAADAVEALTKQSSKYTVHLTADQRKAALKGRPGGNEIADKIGGLAGKYHVVIPNMTLADMQADQTLA